MNDSPTPTYSWSTSGLLGEHPTSQLNALIILNTPLPNHALFAKLWDAGNPTLLTTSSTLGRRLTLPVQRLCGTAPTAARTGSMRILR